MSPKSHAPAPSSNISLNSHRKGKGARSIEYWAMWDQGWRPDTYLVVPKSVAKFTNSDPRKGKWRRNVKGK